MLGTVLIRLQVKVTSLISTAKESTQLLLSKTIGVLTTMQTLFADSLTNLQLQFALISQKFKALVASLTLAVSSIKVALTTVKVTLTQIGLLLQTIVRQTLQLAKQAWNLGRSLAKKDTQEQSQK